MKIKLYPNKNDDSLFIADILKEELVRNHYEIAENCEYDLGIAIGGDGSFLHMVASSDFNSSVYYVGVNNGTLGFLQEIKPTELNLFIDNINKKNYKIENISYEEIKVVTEEEVCYFKALNETVIRDLNLSTAYLDVTIDNVLLEKFVGDGLLISTPIGSTAYNMSGNGAIVYSGLHTLQMIPLAPINNNIYRTLGNPIIIPETKVIRLKPTNRTKDIMLLIDGVNHSFKNVKYVEILISEEKLQCLRMKEYDYTTIINDKFLN